MNKELTQGARAVANGLVLEDAIRSALRVEGYTALRADSLGELTSKRTGLFPEAGCFAQQCHVPLTADCHAGRNRRARVDFVALTRDGETVLVSAKSQTSDGSAEQKLEYEIRDLLSTELPAAMLVHGPVKGRDAATGWTLEVLEKIWERTRADGGNRILLFRTIERLQAWIHAGLPVRGRGRTASTVFAEFCDREP
jgi:phage terminase large subunit GpA-like protein